MSFIRRGVPRDHPFPEPERPRTTTIRGTPAPEHLPSSINRRPCRCLFCGETVLYDLELSCNLNCATGCSKSRHGLHACAEIADDNDTIVVDPPSLCESLGAFFDGELDEPAAKSFRDHLAGCSTCERELHTQMQLHVITDQR